ncbi:hypothetical protein X975_25761, partial [Stegodyphus mimosarum]
MQLQNLNIALNQIKMWQHVFVIGNVCTLFQWSSYCALFNSGVMRIKIKIRKENYEAFTLVD